jgi:hypothetical protein
MKRLIFGLLLTAFLSGCVGVPNKSGIFQGELLEAPNSNSVVRVIARGPQPGMNQIEIVQGFLDASASSENDYAVARLFLSPVAALNWTPELSVQVYEGVGRLNSNEIDSISFTALKDGEIDIANRYKLAKPAESIDQEFNLVRVDGEWRILNAPRGLLISKADLNRSWRIYPLWFPDLEGQVLVPDPVIVPQAVSGTATLLMQVLLKGPSRDIAVAVKTAFPQGADLGLAAVTVENSVASVSLNAAVLNTTPQQRQLMSAQITKTLTSIPGINAVRITVGTQVLPIEDKPLQQTASDWQELMADANRTQNAVVTFNGRLFQLEDSAITTPYAAFLANQPANYRAGVTDRNASIYAALSADGTQIYVGNLASTSRPQLVLTGNSFRNPYIDRNGLIWVTSPDGVQVVNSAEVRPVIIEENLNEDEIVDVIPAPDGVRAAVILSTVAGNQLRLATIERDATGVRLTRFRTIEKIWNNIAQVSWETNSILVLVDTTAELTTVASIDTFTGNSRVIDFMQDVVSISASPIYPILVQTADGTLYASDESKWRTIGKYQNPQYPG